jgi:hypothetical protein
MVLFTLNTFNIGLEVLTPATVKISVFRDAMLYSPAEVAEHLRGMCRLHLQSELLSFWTLSVIR